MNQISEKNANPKNPMNKMSATPIPVPAAQAFRSSLVAWSPQLFPAVPVIAQSRINADQMINTHVIFRQ
jgi:hypothetical protein